MSSQTAKVPAESQHSVAAQKDEEEEEVMEDDGDEEWVDCDDDDNEGERPTRPSVARSG